MEVSWYKAYPGLDRTVNLVNNCLRYEMIPESLIYLANVGFRLHGNGNQNAPGPSVQFIYLALFGSRAFGRRQHFRNNSPSIGGLKRNPVSVCRNFFRLLDHTQRITIAFVNGQYSSTLDGQSKKSL
jgi:hypothetical protein